MLAYRIRKARTDRGWGQGELAEKFGKTRTAIVNWETGYSKPDNETLTEIAQLLNTDIEWLLDTSNDEDEKLEHRIRSNRKDGAMTEAEQMGERLRLCRKKKNLSGDVVAELLGVSRQTISGYECGKREPNFAVLIKLSELYDVSIDFILGVKKDRIANQEIYYEDWILEIATAKNEKKIVIKQIWDTIKGL